MADLATIMVAGIIGIFVPALVFTLISGKGGGMFLGWLAIWMMVGGTFSLVPVWFEYVAIVMLGVFVFMRWG
jgi:hypothetical protein